MRKYASRVGRATAAYWREMDRVANQIRAELIIPYCNRHRLAFTSGMGTWGFTRERGRTVTERIILADEVKDLPGAKRIASSLEIPTAHGPTEIGHLIEAYYPPDWKKL